MYIGLLYSVGSLNQQVNPNSGHGVRGAIMTKIVLKYYIGLNYGYGLQLKPTWDYILSRASGIHCTIVIFRADMPGMPGMTT